MAQFPSEQSASGIWTLKDVLLARMGANWPGLSFYQISDPYLIHLLTETESMLKTYLPEIKFNVRVKKINVPIKTQEMWII